MKVGAKSYCKTNIKEISIVSNFDGVKELMRISKKWISYKNLSSNNRFDDWSNQLSKYSETYDCAYEYICTEIMKLFSTEYNGEPACDYDPGFNIRVTFDDNVYCDLSYKGDMANNNMKPIAFVIKRMCLPNVVFPKAITVFKNKKLTREVIDKANPDDIRAMLISIPTAKGVPSNIEVLIDDTYYMSGQLKPEIFDAVVLYLFKKLNFTLEEFTEQKIFEVCHMALNKKLWWYVDLGGKNQLILRDKEFLQSMDILLRSITYERYIYWKSLVANERLDISFLEM